MSFPALFDTNVLYGALLNDYLLTLADYGLFRNDPKDRHVLAAAVRGGAEVLVTFNQKDFPRASTADFDVEVVHPDAFLLDQLDLYPAPTLRALEEVTDAYDSPAMTIDDFLLSLARAGVPQFADAAREKLY